MRMGVKANGRTRRQGAHMGVSPRLDHHERRNGARASVKASERLLIVSNRMPSTVRVGRGGIELVQSTGGLATGLRPAHERMNGLWFGWPGTSRRLSPAQRAQMDERLAALRLVPIHLSATDVRRFYHGFSNGVLWPLFHYSLDKIPIHQNDWRTYRDVNARFADAVAARHQRGDLVWVHDYQLALVPALLRERIPDARIAFFLHIPFPSSEVFRVLPWRTEILRGMLGADLIGFHTLAYMRHFSMSLMRVLGLETDIDRVWHEQREVRLGVYPMGIDAAAFDAMSREHKVVEEAAAIRRQADGEAIVLGVDRLDYTKGIPLRLLAFERLLEREPSLRERVRFVEVAAPSREEVGAYAEFERSVDELVGRINGKHGTPRWTPIHYVHRSATQKRLVALYLAADVMAVTPLRDGLNLVAKEFVASRADLSGVLLLSEFAGVASEMSEALLVHPHDVDALAQSLSQARQRGKEERARRMTAMRKRLFTYHVQRWADDILGDLRAITISRPSAPKSLDGSRAARAIVRRMRDAERLVLFVDYDGTLVALAPHPDLAEPDDELAELLADVAADPRRVVHVVSGRPWPTLERWFGKLAIGLHAEHGLWSRGPHTRQWEQTVQVQDGWMEKVRPLLDTFTRATPGSFIEEKSAGLAWHYARAEREFGPAQAQELRLHLMDLLSNAPVHVFAGERVVEIRAQGVSKGMIVARCLASEPADAVNVALGDDMTDEDLFAALPPHGIAIHVGPTRSHAPWRLPDPAAVRSLLRRLAR
jgi:trehalose 6-phosphate synthase/phosphatase